MQKRLLLFALAATLSHSLANDGLAQVVKLGYVFPPAVSIGAESNVALGGYDFTPDTQFFSLNSAVELNITGALGDYLVPPPPYWFGPKGRSTANPIPREFPGRVTVSSDARPGLSRWQAANANGAAATAVVLLSDMPEVVEQRGRANAPQRLERIPLGVSGRLSRIAEVDMYEVSRADGGPITVELYARRLGSNFHAHLQVLDENGRKIVDRAATNGRDLAFSFHAEAARQYTVRLHDIDFRGNRATIYRLQFTPGPRVAAVWPAFGKRGAEQQMEFEFARPAGGKDAHPPIEQTIQFPAEKSLASLRRRIDTDAGPAWIDIPLDDLTETTDRQVAESPIGCAVGSAVTASLSGGVRTFAVKLMKGQPVHFSAQSRALGGDADVALHITDADGKQLAANDDAPGTSDAGVDYTAKADGNVLCRVESVNRARNSTTPIRFAVHDLSGPGFTLTAPQVVAAPIGGKGKIDVQVKRRGGYTEEITLHVANPPKGVTAADVVIAKGKNKGAIELQIDAAAPSDAAMIGVVGSAKIGEQEVRVDAVAPVGGDLAPRRPATDVTTRILLAPTLKAPFKLELIDKNRQRAVHRGTTYRAEFIINRDEGFGGPVQLLMAAVQGRHRQGIRGPIVTVKPGENRALYPSFMPEWLETDRTTRMAVLGSAQVADGAGRERHVMIGADARITMILEGALLKVKYAGPELTVQPGRSFSIPIAISRSVKLTEPVKVELKVPAALAGLVVADPVMLDGDAVDGLLKVTTMANAGEMLGDWKLLVKATALEGGRWPIVSQTEVEVSFESAVENE
ncbi:MAG: hypothetical protein QGG36_10120 [Pirellulaceae bacterium]|jgi:hypothetical protein|nr:hypothetical protein [Pirellulaceae bacterium]MDP7016146.1 hypothetical protein [Pirellulaceae bacterium]